MRQFVIQSLLAEDTPENRRRRIDPEQLSPAAVYSFCESLDEETRSLGMELIRRYPRFQLPEELFRRLGLSVDWTTLYTTIGERSRRVSQLAFLRNLARGEAYQQDAPTLYDIDERTAVAQAEMEDRDIPGAYHQLAFHPTAGGGDLVIDTTRPETVTDDTAAVRVASTLRFSSPPPDWSRNSDATSMPSDGDPLMVRTWSSPWRAAVCATARVWYQTPTCTTISKSSTMAADAMTKQFGPKA